MVQNLKNEMGFPALREHTGRAHTPDLKATKKTNNPLSLSSVGNTTKTNSDVA